MIQGIIVFFLTTDASITSEMFRDGDMLGMNFILLFYDVGASPIVNFHTIENCFVCACVMVLVRR